MFDIKMSKKVIWYLLIIVSLLGIYELFAFDNVHLILFKHWILNIFGSNTRKTKNKIYTQSKKIFVSPVNKRDELSIIKLQNNLKKKLLKNINTKKYHKNSKNKIVPKVITNFDILTNDNSTYPTPKYNIVLFYADWCGHCIEFKPIWNALKQKYRNKITMFEKNCSDQNTTTTFIKEFPTISVFDFENNHVGNYTNDKNIKSFDEFLNNLINTI